MIQHKRKVKLPPAKGLPFEQWVSEMETLEEDEYLELIQGKHYDIKTLSLKQQLWRWARKNNVSIEVREYDSPDHTKDTVYIRLRPS